MATPVNETCTANGQINLSVSNTTPGATIIYNLYASTNLTTPISTTSSTTFSGLIHGSYVVIATQSQGNLTNSQQQQVTIVNDIIQLTYSISSIDEICGNDGVITISTLTGSPPFIYEIFSGPIIRTPQSSNIFNNMTMGQYQIRVKDVCGEGVVQTYTVSKKNPAITFTLTPPKLTSCDMVSLGFGFTSTIPYPGGIVKYPLQVVTTITPQNGSSVITNSIINFGVSFSTISSLLSPQPYTYNFKITDDCGIVYNLNGQVNNLTDDVESQLIDVSCTTKKISFINLSSLIMTSAPSNYTIGLPQSFTSQINNNSFVTPILPAGNYTFQATNLCGTNQIITITIPTQTPNTPYWFPYNLSCSSGSLAFFYVSQIILVSAPTSYTANPLPFDFSSTINTSNVAVLTNIPIGTYVFHVKDTCGNDKTLTATFGPASQVTTTIHSNCDSTTSSVNIQGGLYNVVLTSAPTNYSLAIPYNFTSQIVTNSNLVLDNLVIGTYTFSITNGCNQVSSLSIVIPALIENTNVQSIQNCGSFDISLYHSSSNQANCTFWLQKFFPSSNDWGNPSSSVLQGTGIPNLLNAIQLNNNQLNLNFPYTGHFRIVKVQPIFNAGNTTETLCFKLLYDFQINAQVQIINVNSISCGSTYQVLVDAIGTAPLTYMITTKDGIPFIINNGNSSLFTNISPGTYNFRVIDACGNIVNSIYQINTLNPLSITPNNLCPNQTASLTVPNFTFLTYQWWNNSNPSIITSTTNNLTFNNFNPGTNSGTYTVRITYSGDPNSCLNTVLSYTILNIGYNPNAGTGTNTEYCGNPGSVNLFTLLNNPHDLNGTWNVSSNNTSISGSSWDSSNSIPGIYQFTYTVTGNCSITSSATVSIKIKNNPQNIIASSNTPICENQDINLFSTFLQNATYYWNGPNGFTSNQQNPLITNASQQQSGTYSVQLLLDGCTSNTSNVDVKINPIPVFSISKKCVYSEFTLQGFPINNSLQLNSLSYSWTGPNGFIGSTNPIAITGYPAGNYQLTVVDSNNCSSNNSIQVFETICDIPNFISPNNDSINENLNLIEFNINKIEIYNRWGRLVYEKENYRDEWYGQNMNGGILPDSTYFYILYLESGEIKRGWIFLNKG